MGTEPALCLCCVHPVFPEVSPPTPDATAAARFARWVQEFISLSAFAIFSTYVLKEKLRWADFGAFVLIFAG